MYQETADDNSTGISIRVPVPALDPELYSIGGTSEILTLLSRNRYEQFTQRTLTDNVEQSESTVRRAVDLLEENDLVRCEYDANRKLVEINRQRLSVPDDPILRIPQQEFREPARAAVENLQDDLDDVLAIVLYGSVARGDADRRSDVDLWVLVSDDRAEHQREANAVTNDLEDRRFDDERYEFHVVVESTETVPSFTDEVQQILESGITLQGSPTFEKVRNLIATELHE